MPDSPKPAVEVFFTPEFKRNVRALAKKYHHIQSDVQPFIDQIQRGELIGDKIQGTGYTIDFIGNKPRTYFWTLKNADFR